MTDAWTITVPLDDLLRLAAVVWRQDLSRHRFGLLIGRRLETLDRLADGSHHIEWETARRVLAALGVPASAVFLVHQAGTTPEPPRDPAIIRRRTAPASPDDLAGAHLVWQLPAILASAGISGRALAERLSTNRNTVRTFIGQQRESFQRELLAHTCVTLDRTPDDLLQIAWGSPERA